MKYNAANNKNSRSYLKGGLLFTGFTLIAFLVASCEKEVNGNGLLHVTVEHQDLDVARAVVYLNRDSTYHPDSLNDEYDVLQKADAAGEVSFADLAPGTYYVYALGHERSHQLKVEGMDSVVINKRHRQNSYELTIQTRLK